MKKMHEREKAKKMGHREEKMMGNKKESPKKVEKRENKPMRAPK